MWTCPKCKENIDDQFDSCWKCAGAPCSRIQTALFFKYHRGFFETPRKLAQPPFQEIEDALRRLDGEVYPIVNLYLQGQIPGDSIPAFEVIGGPKGYYVEVVAGGRTSSYYDESAPATPVRVCVCDGIPEVPAQRVCPDLEQVIAAARYFCDVGELLPSFHWHAV